VVVIVNYGVGNLGSILNMFRKIGMPASVSSDRKDIEQARWLILPGVGAFDNGAARLYASGILPALEARVLGDGVPILGICLGMQLLTRRSEEGATPGLGWVDAETRRFSFDPAATGLKIPHMGWNSVAFPAGDSLGRGFEERPRFYFVHSYHVVPRDPALAIGTTRYGYPFTSVFRKNNILGMQFHPEKSHRFGIRILKNFIEGA
jgi:glutamine amidotransferase